MTTSWPSRSMMSPVSSWAITRWLEICPGKRGFQNVASDSGDACWRIIATTSGRATNRASGNRSRTGAGTKEMIAVAMGSTDRGQILAARRNPIRQSARLLDGNECIHQHGVPLAIDQGRGDRWPRPFFFAGSQIACDNGDAWVLRTPPNAAPFFPVVRPDLGAPAAGLPVRGTVLLGADRRSDRRDEGRSEAFRQEFAS